MDKFYLHLRFVHWYTPCSLSAYFTLYNSYDSKTLRGIVSQLGSLDNMDIEVAFRNSATEEVLGGIGDVDFANSALANLLFDTIGVKSLATSSLVIPEFITSVNGDTATTKGIRIALAMRVDGGNNLTQATFNNIRLTKVSSPSIFVLLVIAAGFVAARKRILS